MASSAELQLLFTGKDATAAGFASIKGHLDGLDKSLQTSNTHATNLGGTLLKLGGGAVAGVGVAVAGLATAVGVAGFKFDSFKQQSEIAFTTILGSSDAAKAHLGQLADFAAKTPFEFPDVVRASQRLQAMGIESGKVIPTLTAIGDAVAAMGGGAAQIDRVTTAIGQMQAKGRVQADEMMQLTEAGIPAWQMLADKIGVSIPEAMKLVEKGAVDANTGITALTEGMETRFAGMMDKQSHSMAGLVSTAKDTFGQLSGEIMQPFFDLATRGMERLVQVTSDPAFQEGVKGFAQGLADATAAGIDFLSRVVDVLGQVDWATILGAGRDAFDAIVTAATAVVDFITEHWPEIQATAEAVFAAVREAVEPVIQFVVTEVQRVVDGVKANWPQIQEAAENVFHAVEAVVRAVVQVAIALWQQFGDDLVNITTTAWTYVSQTIDNAITIIGGLLKIIISLINGDWNGAWEGTKQVIGGFKDQLGTVADFLKTSLADAFHVLIDLLRFSFAPQLDAAAGAARGLATGIGAIASAAQGAIGWVKSLGDALDNLPGADKLAHLIGRSPSPLAIGIASVGDAAEGATPPLLAFADAAAQAAAAGAAAMAAMGGETARPISRSEDHTQTGIRVQTVENYAGVAGLTQSTVSDSFGTFTTFSVPDWLLEAYGQNLEAVLRDIAAGQGRFRSGGRQMAQGGVLDDLTLWYQPRTGRHGSMAEAGPEYVVPAGGLVNEAGMERAMVRALSRAPVDASQHVYLTRGTQLDADRAQRAYLARRRTEAGRRR